MSKHESADHISDRVDAMDIGLKLLVDQYLSPVAHIDSYRIDTDSLGVYRPSRCDERLVARDFLPAGEQHVHSVVPDIHPLVS